MRAYLATTEPMRPSRFEIALDEIERTLRAVHEDQPARPDREDLAGKLGPDRATGTRDHDNLVADDLVHARSMDRHLLPGQEQWGAADNEFPQLLSPVYRPADGTLFDPDGPGPAGMRYCINSLSLGFDPQAKPE